MTTFDLDSSSGIKLKLVWPEPERKCVTTFDLDSSSAIMLKLVWPEPERNSA